MQQYKTRYHIGTEKIFGQYYKKVPGAMEPTPNNMRYRCNRRRKEREARRVKKYYTKPACAHV